MPQFTKNAISESFFRIAAKKPPEKITVKDIVEDCGVTRNTFYYYFRDVYDVIEDAFLTVAGSLQDTENVAHPSEIFSKFADFLYAHRAAMRNICSSVGYDAVNAYLSRASEPPMRAAVLQTANGLPICEADQKLIVSLFQEAVLGLLLDWLKSDSDSPPSALLERISLLGEGALPLLLHNAADHPASRS